MTSTRAGRRRKSPLGPLVERVEAAGGLDGPARAVAARVRKAAAPTPVKEALSGTWLGHALHPVLTDVAIGSLLSATMLDVLGGDDGGRARRRLIAIGIVAAGPTAMTGANDWADSEYGHDGVRRVGLVHAACNTGALTLYGASLAARRGGRRGRGTLLGLGGATMLMASGYLGGHLTFAQGIGPDQTVYDPGPAEWTAASDAAGVTAGRPTRVVVDDTPILLLRDGAELFALHDRCSHRGCSLAEGRVEDDEIVCPCHGSRFARADGAVRRGPATAPQPTFEVRERGGALEVRRRVPG
ncbi:MAG TPA: Rieske (2Fe-2S) protein [Baekduia sp.]|uniref:Rieske (2Fe-2S) protein n=1 Tax=Baekduia sp. TaxID=2600305 RepID=UPI002C45069B|nr:Rieske (2Fe-2S) protein [Baekduia sp.]HMJ35577.1 Rieske (2Fe-2S) protein [Baekduia sp.]